ncbi:MAG: aminodeoxychorismate/anthranilate synthase component II, partial [Acidobacteria bacterium]|nr:aminodeoxychorismate/anthranilate synthase component II [Acidobacteriota bacterium]
QYLGELGEDVEVKRNDEISLTDIERNLPSRLLISPGPGQPEDAGISLALIEHFGHSVPILGVCLGHQAIGQVFGGHVVRAPTVVHGKGSEIFHDGKSIFQDLDSPFEAGRYHSLVVERESLPPCLEVSAETSDGLIMGLRHREQPIEGVQFHPESILTPEGKKTAG